MSTSIDINGKNLLPIKEASSVVDYSRDYITRLARERKIVATQIGRNWFIDADSLKNYHEVTQTEQEIKKRLLSDERREELKIKSLKETRRKIAEQKASKKLPVTAVLMMVVALGLGTGTVLESQYRAGFENFTQLANIETGLTENKLNTKTHKVEIGSEDSISRIIPTFTPRVTQKSIDSDEGLLLLPKSADRESFVENYFSDPVKVILDDEGNNMLVRVDVNGNPVGENIPYIIVPINSELP